MITLIASCAPVLSMPDAQANVFVSGVIPAPIDVVWPYVATFTQLQELLPLQVFGTKLTSSHLVGDSQDLLLANSAAGSSLLPC